MIPDLSKSYLYDDSTQTFQSDPLYHIENFFSAGAIYSPVEDLLKFDQAIFTGKLLSESRKRLLNPDTALGNVALGFWKSAPYGPFDQSFYYRPGAIYGSTANWIHVVDSNISLIVFSNNNANDLFGLSQRLYAAGKLK